MRARVIAGSAALALVAAGTTATALTVVEGGSEAPVYRVSQTWDHGRTAPMHGTAVTSEFSYLTQMVVHHEEAVAAARELERSARPELRRFGASIVETQTAQMAQMQEWLERWYPDRPTEGDYRPMMRDLSGLSGDDLDRAFLHDMIGHHMAAVMMSQQLLNHGLADHGEVEDLAATIRDEQHAEIVQMHRWLADWFGTRSGRTDPMGPGMGPGGGMGPGPGPGMGPGTGGGNGPGMGPGTTG